MAGNGARDPLFSLNVIEESMRIVFVLAEADLSGGVRTVATYARLLSERGHVVTIVSTPPMFMSDGPPESPSQVSWAPS